MEKPALTLEQEKEQLLSNYNIEELLLYNTIIQETNCYSADIETISYSVSIREDKSNGE